MCENVFLCRGLGGITFFGRYADTGIKAHHEQGYDQQDHRKDKQIAQIAGDMIRADQGAEFFPAIRRLFFSPYR